MRTQGVERRQQLVDDTNSWAEELGIAPSASQPLPCTGLSFVQVTCSEPGGAALAPCALPIMPRAHAAPPHADPGGADTWQGYISDSLARIDGSEEGTDVLVALHACDTATDDAICAGIRAGARVIIVAPCCHKELRGQMDGPRGQQRTSGVLQDVMAHGILAGRMAETTTDAIRALLLQIMGYKTQVFEFIDGVHTAKNVMITAIKTSDATPTEKGAAEREALRRRLALLMEFYGIGVQRLAMLLGENPESDSPRYHHQVGVRGASPCASPHVALPRITPMSHAVSAAIAGTPSRGDEREGEQVCATSVRASVRRSAAAPQRRSAPARRRGRPRPACRHERLKPGVVGQLTTLEHARAMQEPGAAAALDGKRRRSAGAHVDLDRPRADAAD